MKEHLRPALLIFLSLTFITGIAYPLLITGIAQAAFPREANGSLVVADGKVVGSSLIGQSFDEPGYFWGRVSATSLWPYNASSSSGSNLGPSNPRLIDAVKRRLNALHAADPNNPRPVPVDLVTSSASGLDPHISPAAALYQIPRIARARNMNVAQLERLVAGATQTPLWGVLGESRVNVLLINLSLDQAASDDSNTSRSAKARL